MKKNQKKWEKEFEKFSRGEFDDRYNELSDKISNKTCTKDELKEFKRLDLVKKNLPKVKNIMEYRDKLNHEREIIDGELKRREEARNLNKERADLEKENADLLLKIDEINSKLKSKDLSEEDRKKLENDKKQNIEKRNKNNEKFLDNQQKMENNLSGDNKYMAKISDKELEEEKVLRSTKISKCNMACNNLMQGKSWEAIEVKLDNWENYKGKKGQAEELKNSVEHAETNREDNSQRNENDSEDKETSKEQVEELKGKEVKEEKALVEYKSFSERHPILAKIPFLAKIADKLNKSKNEKAVQENENNEKQNDEVINDVAESLGKEVGKIIDEDSKEEKNQNEEFKKYLKDIADKGMDGIKKERMERARVLLAQNKVDKANEYAEKYGSRYNEQDGASKDEGPEL